jgi:hypothetical protein
MRGLQVTEFTALDAVVDLIRDMPMNEAALQAIVDALARRCDENEGRFAVIVDLLGDVHEALEALAAAERAAASECSGCDGTGGERAPCRPCGGRGVVSAFSDDAGRA